MYDLYHVFSPKHINTLSCPWLLPQSHRTYDHDTT